MKEIEVVSGASQHPALALTHYFPYLGVLLGYEGITFRRYVQGFRVPHRSQLAPDLRRLKLEKQESLTTMGIPSCAPIVMPVLFLTFTDWWTAGPVPYSQWELLEE